MLAERLADWTDEDVDELIRLMTRLRASFGDCRSAPLRLPAPVDEETTRTPAST